MTPVLPTVTATKGLIVSPHYLASSVGAEILKNGGNAIDAAIATNATLGVVYPHMCGIGGDAFFIIYDANSGKPVVLNASGRSPYKAKRELFKSLNMSSIPIRGILSITVPGVVDGWCNALQKFGTKNLSELLQPAIEYAERGISITEKHYWFLTENRDVLTSSPKLAEKYINNGQLLRPGETIKQKDYASSLRKIAEGGRNAFYEGEIAENIVNFSEENGGLLSERDFRNHTSDWAEPISTSYRDLDIYAAPPNSQGLATLIELNIIEGSDLNKIRWNDSEYIHLCIEAKKIAFDIRDKNISDPEFANPKLTKILSKEYATELREKIDRGKTGKYEISEQLSCGDTVCVCTIDEKGNAVSLIQSIYYPWGSGIVPGDTGIILQNRGAYFSLEDSHINRIESHKRTMHTLSPLMALKNQKPNIIMGTMGADGQPQTHLQILSKIIDFKIGVQEAIELPRWLSGRFNIGEPEDTIRIEKRMHEDVAKALKVKGHKIVTVSDWSQIMGHAQMIMMDEKTGYMHGGADPRGDSAAVGL